MIPDAASTPPRKRPWKRWALASACVLAIALAVVFLKAPTPEPVTVTFVGSTNDNGQRILHFKGTNGLPKKIGYYAGVNLTSVKAAQASGGLVPYHRAASGEVAAGETFMFSLNAPLEDRNWQVDWAFQETDHVPTGLEKVRARCYLFLAKHGMQKLARVAWGGPRTHIIRSAEFKE